MKSFIALVSRNPRLILGLIFLITVYMLWGTTKLTMRNNSEADLPEDDPVVKTMNHIKEVFDDKSIVIIGVESDNIYNISTLKKVTNITEELKSLSDVISDEVVSLSTVNNIKSKDGMLQTGAFMQEVPTTEDELAQLKTQIKENDNIYGQLVNEEGTFTVIRANVMEGYDQAVVHKQVNEILKKYQGSEKLYASGKAIYTEDIDSGINADSQLLIPILMLIMLVVFYIIFRSWRGVFLPALLMLLSVIWAMGAMGHIGLPITVVSNALPALMIAVASSYGIHVIHRYYEEIVDKTKEEAVMQVMYSLGPAILLTGITSALSAGSLIVFKVVSIKEFGLIGAIGISSTLFLSLTLLPSLLLLLKKSLPKKDNLRFINEAVYSMTQFALKRKRFVLAGYGLLIIFAAYGISKVIVGGDFSTFFPEGHPGRVSMEIFNDKLNGSRTLDIMIEGKDIDALKDPRLLNEILKFQQYMKEQEGVGNAFSFADVLKQIHKVMNNDNAELSELPESKELIAQYLLLYSMSGNPGDFSDLVDHDYQRAKIQVMLTTSEPTEHKRLYKLADNYVKTHIHNASASFGGDTILWIAQMGYIVTGKIWNTIISILMILILSIIIYRSFVRGFLAILPLSISIASIFGLMGFLDIRLELGTAILTAMVAGIGIDYAIHYLNRYREEMQKDLNIDKACGKVGKTVGQAITFDYISNVLSFGVLAFASFTPVQNFGILMALSNLIVGLNTLILFPALLSFLQQTFTSRIKNEKTKAAAKEELVLTN